MKSHIQQSDRFRSPELYANGEANFGSEWGGEEEAAMVAAFREVATNGPHLRTQQLTFEEELARFARMEGEPQVACTSVNSCGVALDLVFDFLRLQAGDEVITCGLNFFGAHLSVLRRGATLVFAESEEDGINIDPVDALSRITSNTRAILVTHMNGLPADTDSLQRGLHHRFQGDERAMPLIVEDVARSVGASLPRMTRVVRAFSFHRKKMISTLGEGGAVATSLPGLTEFVARARSYGLGDGFGTSYRLTEPQAAVGRVQLGRLSTMVARRRLIVAERQERFANAGVDEVIATVRRPGDAPSMHVMLLTPEMVGRRGEFVAALRRHGIGSVAGPLPTFASHSVVGKRVHAGTLPNTELISERALCLPVHPAMSDADEAHFSATFLRVAKQILTA